MEFSIDPVEGVRLRRVTVSAKALFGMLYQPDVKPQTLEEIDEAIGRYHAEEDSRIRRGEEEGHKG